MLKDDATSTNRLGLAHEVELDWQPSIVIGVIEDEVETMEWAPALRLIHRTAR